VFQGGWKEKVEERDEVKKGVERGQAKDELEAESHCLLVSWRLHWNIGTGSVWQRMQMCRRGHLSPRGQPLALSLKLRQMGSCWLSPRVPEAEGAPGERVGEM